MGRVFLYDTTLRDGAQTEGVLFLCKDKIELLKRLDAFGMDFVEGGWPGSNPCDDEFFKTSAEMELKNSKLVAFGSTSRHGTPADEDPGLKTLASCSAEWCCIFGKAWDLHVVDALGITLEDNLKLVRDSVSFLRRSGKRVIFDAEHFFDGFAFNMGYALDTIRAAAEAGAEWVVLCDTNGGSLPDAVEEAVREARKAVDVPLGIHCHNDSDLATSCTLAAVRAGCTMVQGTVNGIGERCGNANLCTVAPNLSLKMGMDLGRADLASMTDLSRFVGEVANMVPNPGMPYVGSRAFAHKSGMHISAISKNPRTYEHVEPSSVGNDRRVLVSNMAGRTSISEKLRELGLEGGDDDSEIRDMVKRLESRGYQFEGADASFELLVRRLRGELEPKFEIAGFRIYTDDREGGTRSEASIKVSDRKGHVAHTAADGNGPVNALDNALRKGLACFFPELDDVKLVDYKVRVLDEGEGTETGVRVLIRSTDGREDWTTVGVSVNIIQASLTALEESIQYALMRRPRTDR
ncbi:MAG: citramalate synthase [Candidatus Methanomethylophilaceae archaeon]|nr:citramalate synthase [Candidatus Methanomethylophilaceae archaeon]